jgi:transposase-like protein
MPCSTTAHKLSLITSQSKSTPLERLTKEIKRRTYAMGAFSDQPSVIRLVGSIFMEITDEWEVTRSYFSHESMRKFTDPEPVLVSEPPPFRLAPVH